MGFFDDEDLENALDDPFKIVGKSPVKVSDAKILKGEGKEPVFIVTYKNDAGQSHQEWLKLAKFGKDEADKARRRSHSKKILTELGVPESELNSVEPADLIGREGVLEVYKRGQWYNYGSFKLNESGNSGDGLVVGESQITQDELAQVGASAGDDFFS